MPHVTLHLLNAFLLAVVLIQVLNPIAGYVGLLDRPGGRKIHHRIVPLTGGLAMFGGFLIAASQLEAPVEAKWNLLGGLTLLVALGVVDDISDLGPWEKLAGQSIASLVIILPGHHLIGPGELLGVGHVVAPALLDVGFTLVFVVGLINAFNMLDGLDGLAGGAAAAALLWLAVAARLSGVPGTGIHALLLFTAVLAFLVFNARHPWRSSAAVFMGDAGSMMLGAATAFFILDLSADAAAGLPFPALVWVVALPVFDTLVLIARRAAAGRNPLQGDRRHVHHLMLRAGLSQRSAALLLVAACLLCGGFGVIGGYFGVADRVMLAGLAVPFLGHLYFVTRGWRRIASMHGSLPPGDEPAAANPLLRAESDAP